MKIILSLCLVAFVACDGIPEIGHPNAQLIEEAKNMMLTQKSSRIINGDDTQISKHPWQASLQRSSGHICGAVIVGEFVAVTAAHCVVGTSARFFALRVGSTKSSSGGTLVPVTGKVEHQGYSGSSSGYPNDIAILYTSGSLTADVNANEVILPTDNENDFSGQDCQITGWGLTNTNPQVRPDTLQVADTKVINQTACRSAWGNAINAGHVCLYTGYNSACMGDSGGPLTCGGVLVGVTSWGSSNCYVSSPSVYTRISYFLGWIQDTMASLKKFK